jgi:hypothetical protein
MTWKSYAVVSGAGLLATYLASGPTIAPDRVPASRPAVATPSAQAPVDIQEQAERLRLRVREKTEYKEPSRNPFRFGARPARRAPVRTEALAAEELIVTPDDPPPQPPPIRLSGIATERIDGVRRRTAVLITLQGVLEVREGDPVGAEYRVLRIEEDAVELIASDGSTRRLTVRP